MNDAEITVLDGDSLTIDTLVSVVRGKRPVDLSLEAWDRVRQGRSVVETMMQSGKAFYGINTRCRFVEGSTFAR